MNLSELEQQYGLPPGLLSAVMGQESGGKADAVSPKGALGAFQFMPATAKQYGVNPLDPESSAQGAAKYYRDLLAQNNGDLPKALASYNWGPGNVAKYGIDKAPPETQNYVKKVTAKMADPMDWLEANAPKQQAAPKGDAAMSWLEANAPKAPEVGAGQAALIAGGRGLDRLAAGLRQAVPDGVRSAVDALGQKLGMGEPPSIDPAVQAGHTAAYRALQDQQPLATFAGELPQMMAAKTPLGMAAMGALEYGTPEERATNAAGGYIGGKAGSMLAGGLSRLVTPLRGAGEEAVNATKALLDKYGVTGLPGQITGSAPLKWIESTVASLPGGGAVRQNIAAQQQGLNRAAMEAMGGSGNAVTPETAQAALNAAGSRIGNIPKGITVTTDDTLLNALGNVESRYSNKLDALQKPVVQKLIDQISSMPTMSGEFYQATRSDLSRMAAGAQGGYQDALTGIYKALDRAFDRSAGPDAAAAMQAARGQYSAGKEIAKMATETGNISAARLATAAKVLPPAGRELASLGEAMRPLPNSGTAPRLAVQALLSGGVGTGYGLATGDPMQGLKAGLGTAGAQLAGPYLAAQLLTKAPSRAYLTNTLLSPEIEAMLKKLGASSGGLLGLQASR